MIAGAIGGLGETRQDGFDLPLVDSLGDLLRPGAREHLRQPGADPLERPGQRVTVGDGIEVQHLVRALAPRHVVVVGILDEAVEAQELPALAVLLAEDVDRDAPIVEPLGCRVGATGILADRRGCDGLGEQAILVLNA